MERAGENPERCGYCEKIYVNINRIAEERRGGYQCRREDLEYMEDSIFRRH